MAALAAAPARAAQTKWFVLDTPRALAGASARGMAIFQDGSLRPLPPLEVVAQFDEPLGLALAVAPDGTAFVGTGHPAHVWRIAAGKKELLGELGADQVTAALLDPDGNLFVSTAVPATLLRLPHGRRAFEEVARLAEGNIWDLAWFQGRLLAAAGNPGRLLRLTDKGLELAAEIPDKHARCLAVAGSTVLIGTSGQGRVLRWTGESPPGVLYDSTFTEIAALAAAPDGTVYAAALTGDPTLGQAPKADGDATVTATVTVSEGAPATPQTDKGSATSEIIRILPAGAATTAYRFTKQLAGTLAWGDEGLVIGTGGEGEIWQLVEGAAAELDAADTAQVVRLAAGGRYVLAQSPVKLLERRGAPHGTFTSPALDAGQPARWGEVEVRGPLDEKEQCTLRFRSGVTATPDDSWSTWTPPQPCAAATASAPPARYLQWQLSLSAPAGQAARVERVLAAYRQVNLPPEVREFTVHDPGEVFLKSPPPSERIVEVQHPDLSGIFTTLDSDDQEAQDRLGKKYYRVGYQSLSWKVEDPNGDPLRFAVEIQRAGSDRFWPIRKELETVVIAVDTQALPDGLYRFRLSATDAAANPEAPASVQALSSWVTVDNTPPRLAATRDGDTWVVTVEDDLSPLELAEWNRDADVWHPILPADGLLDSRRETFRIPAEGGRHLVVVRAVDDHHNRATLALEEKP